MVNSYYEVITEQFKIIKNSGLYDVCDTIYVCCLGKPEELKRVSLFFDKTKIKIEAYNTKLDFYEFITLKHLKYTADNTEPFYGFYIHTKGVSYKENYEGGKYWRDYMNHYILRKWKDDIKKLDEGYDLCGVKLLDEKSAPAYQLHYSGNFFWFRSVYAMKLPLVDNMNIDNRFEAEMWIGKAKPKTATLCQEFVDYNTKGKFCPPDDHRNVCFTLGYNLVSEIRKSVDSLYRLNEDVEHFIIDLGFPLEKDIIPEDIKKSQKNNSVKIKQLAKKYGSKYLKFENVGVSQNWTAVYKHIKPSDDDILIGVDPDERPLDRDWIKAMEAVFKADKTIGVCSLMMTDHATILNGYGKRKIGGIDCYEPLGLVNWALIGIKGKFLNLIKEIPVPEKAPKYGWLEHGLLELLKEHKYRWVILCDYRVEHTECSTIYRQWKNKVVFEFEKGQIDFIDWLCDKKETLKSILSNFLIIGFQTSLLNLELVTGSSLLY